VSVRGVYRALKQALEQAKLLSGIFGDPVPISPQRLLGQPGESLLNLGLVCGGLQSDSPENVRAAVRRKGPVCLPIAQHLQGGPIGETASDRRRGLDGANVGANWFCHRFS